MHGRTLYDTDLELHGAQLVENVAHVVAYDRPRDAVVALGGCLDDVSGHVVESDHVSQHANGLVERAEPTDQKIIVCILFGRIHFTSFLPLPFLPIQCTHFLISVNIFNQVECGVHLNPIDLNPGFDGSTAGSQVGI